jgi:NADH dehydrogenase (ubiquinone) 1 alpha subcomplex subunit 13
MALRPDPTKPIQDLPPPGGYKPLDFTKKVPGPRMSGLAMFAVVGLMVTYGFSKVIEGNNKKRELKAERRFVRATILPFLQAEEDARYLRDVAKSLELERRIMQGVEGWEVGKSPYHTTWMPPGDNRYG